MNLNGKTLEEWLDTNSPEVDGKRPLIDSYRHFRNVLHELHKEVTKGATLENLMSKNGTDGFEYDKVIWLNDHGPKHIQTVVERATQLVKSDSLELSAREVYILLCAIQLHDIGNYLGRNGHEKRIIEVLNSDSNIVGFDAVERSYIVKTAQVHGGKVLIAGEEDKNTISQLKQIVTIQGNEIRQRLLASVVRFADELADDSERADKKLLIDNKLPKSSQVFHAFSFCLDTIKVDFQSHTIKLHFKVPVAFLSRTFGKISKDENIIEDVYLIDEIYSRTLKMHLERMYCAKFWKSHIPIDKIWAEIEFYFFNPEEVKKYELHPDITFHIHEEYYPSDSLDIFRLCPDLKYKDGSKMNGENIRKKIEQHVTKEPV